MELQTVQLAHLSNVGYPLWKVLADQIQIYHRSDNSFLDVELVCPNGSVRVHGFLLQALSPFFRELFTAQGFQLGLRTVVLPDYDVCILRSVVDLIYTGMATVCSQTEVNEVHKTITDWKIAINLDSVVHKPNSECSSISSPTGYTTRIGSKQMEQGTPIRNKSIVSTGVNLKVPRPQRSQKSKAPHTATPCTTGSTTPSCSSQTLEAVELIGFGNKNRSPDLLSSPDDGSAEIFKISKENELKENMLKSSNASKADVVSTPPMVTPASSDSPTLRKESSLDSDVDSDLNIKLWRKDPSLFGEAFAVCGKCNKKYPNAQGANKCITELHNLVRCFLCLCIFEDHKSLYRHYEFKHGGSEMAKTIECSFCKAVVSYKSVETHVMTKHLRPPKRHGLAPGKPISNDSLSPRASTEEPESKRSKTEQ